MFREIIVVECENRKKCVHCMANAMLHDVTAGTTTSAQVAVRCFSENRKKERKKERNSKTTDVPLSTEITACAPHPHVGLS
jgi:hypothetical protein